jgi:hypothetical protein
VPNTARRCDFFGSVLTFSGLAVTNHRMKHAIVRNFALFGGLGLSGAVCVMAAPYLTSIRGASGPSMLLAQSPVIATAAVIICLTLATMVSIVVGRLVNAAMALFVLGAGLFVLSGRLETISEIALASDGSRHALLVLSVETMLWALLCFAAVSVVFRVAGPLADVHPLEEPDSLLRHFGARPSAESRVFVRLSVGIISHLPIKGQALKSLVSALLMLPIVWVIAQSPMKGQMLGATFVGAMMVGLVGRLVAPNVQPVFLFVAPIVVGALGHLIGLSLVRAPLDVAWVTGQLPKFNLPMPIDYAAGSLMGVAVGVGWARSFLHHEEQPATAASS